MENSKINGLVKKYIVWPELQNDFQKNIKFNETKVVDMYQDFAKLSGKRKSIDVQIALFYLANEKLSKARINSQDVLGVKELEDYQFYQKTLNKLSKQLLAYILVCCLVEARHGEEFYMFAYDWTEYMEKNHPTIKIPSYNGNNLKAVVMSMKDYPQSVRFMDKKLQKYIKNLEVGQDKEKFINFFIETQSSLIDTFSSNNRELGYKKIVTKFLANTISDYSIGDVLSYLKVIFAGNAFSHGFGGKAWAGIAEHGLNFVHGKMNSEMFIDQAFSLEHNGGNMFNKDYIFREPQTLHLEAGTYKEKIYGHIHTYHLSFNLNALFLNAQHLGMVASLFKLEEAFEKMKEIPIETMYQEIKKNSQFKNISEFNFKKMHETITVNYNMLISALEPVKQEIQKTYPKLLNEKDITPLNIEKLFIEIANRNSDPSSNYNTSSNAKILLEEKNEGIENRNIFSLWNYINNQMSGINEEKKIEREFNFNVYDIEDLPIDQFKKEIIGGKAWSLANMINMNLPIPKAKVFTTECCAAYYHHKKQFDTSLKSILPQFKAYLQDNYGNPVLCSVRSGAPISMPGMMDTVLNVGIDDSNYTYFCEALGKKVTHDCINKFIKLFCSSRLGIEFKIKKNLIENLTQFKEILEINKIKYNKEAMFPLNTQSQIKESLYAVFDSWHSERAKAYRIEKGISHDLGTAAIVQQMVFGNLNDKSCTGVVFSRDCLTGEDKLVGEFLPKAQGEDVVSGSVTPFSIEQFKKFNIDAYDDLYAIAKRLEYNSGQIQDIEFTVEDGQLYILQHRQAVCSPIAAVRLLQDESLDKKELIKQIEPKLLQHSLSVDTKEIPVSEGLSANSGVIIGIVIKNKADIKKYAAKLEKIKENSPNAGFIFYANLTSPEHMPIMNETQAFITEQGGFTSHAAIIARSLNKPCVVGLGGKSTKRFSSGQIITVDGTHGKIWKAEQKVVENTALAQSAIELLMSTNNIKEEHLEQINFVDRLNKVNEKNRSWIFNFPEAEYVHDKVIKKEKFLAIGQKMAMILAANQREKMKL